MWVMRALCLSTEVDPKEKKRTANWNGFRSFKVSYSFFFFFLLISSCWSLNLWFWLIFLLVYPQADRPPLAQRVENEYTDPNWPEETRSVVANSSPDASGAADRNGKHRWGVLVQHSRPGTKAESEARKTWPRWNCCTVASLHTYTHCMLRPPLYIVWM